jgi:formate dehydrogenase major subunit
MKQITLTVNGRQVRGNPGDTVLEVCRSNDIDLPTLCHLDGLTDVGGCRMCIVDIERERKPVPSCTYPAREGLVVRTHTEQIEKHRRLILELLFTERNHFCMYCEKSGDCELQKLAYKYRMDNVRFSHRYPALPLDSMSDSIVMDHNRCTLCGRCIRECREMAGNSTLDFGNRGWKTLVVADLAQSLGKSSCTSCGACVQACPTGAMFSKLSLYKGLPNDCERVTAVCPSCGVGCKLDVYVKDNNLVRIDAAEPHGPRGTLCREGRFELLREPGPRVTSPLVRSPKGILEECSYDKALDAIAGKAAELQGGFAGIVSTRMPTETLSLFGELMRKAAGSDLVDTTDGWIYRLIREGVRRFQDNGKGLDIECSIEEILSADCILVVGAYPGRTHPVVGNLVQRARSRQGTRLVVIDSSRNPFPFWADLWLKPKKGTEAVLITGLARTHLFNGLTMVKMTDPNMIGYLSQYEKAEVAGITGIEEADLEKAVEMYGKAQRAMIVYGQDLLDAGDPEAVTSLLKLAAVTGNMAGDRLRVISLKPGSNSRGAWQMGLASRGMDWDRVKGTYLLLGDDRINGGLLEHLTRGDFLAVQASYESAATAAADVVLPSPMWAERAGKFVSLDGSVSESRHVLERRQGLLSVRETLDALSKKMGRALTGGQEVERGKG